jgi:hypothetical protein
MLAPRPFTLTKSGPAFDRDATPEPEEPAIPCAECDTPY